MNKKIFLLIGIFLIIAFVVLAIISLFAYFFYFKSDFLTQKWAPYLKEQGFQDNVITVKNEKDLGDGVISLYVVHSSRESGLKKESIVYVDQNTGENYIIATTTLPFYRDPQNKSIIKQASSLEEANKIYIQTIENGMRELKKEYSWH